jgi:splicing factor 3B subunit 4
MTEDTSSKSRGFGFVTFDSFESADLALNAMNGQWLGGRTINVSYAFKKDGSKGERHGSDEERRLESTRKSTMASIRPKVEPMMLMQFPSSKYVRSLHLFSHAFHFVRGCSFVHFCSFCLSCCHQNSAASRTPSSSPPPLPSHMNTQYGGMNTSSGGASMAPGMGHMGGMATGGMMGMGGMGMPGAMNPMMSMMGMGAMGGMAGQPNMGAPQMRPPMFPPAPPPQFPQYPPQFPGHGVPGGAAYPPQFPPPQFPGMGGVPPSAAAAAGYAPQFPMGAGRAYPQFGGPPPLPTQ